MSLLAVEAAVAVAGVQVAAVGGAWALRRREGLLQRYLPHLLSLAVGVLLATALLDLMPEAVERLGNRKLTWALVAVAMLGLFCVERIFSALTGSSTEPEVGELGQGTHVHRHGHASCNEHSAKPTNLVIAAMMHSLVDGTAVATAFVAGPRVGWLTAVAIALHEIPHRIGDFAVLVHLRLRPGRALGLAALAGLPSLLGTAIVVGLGASRTTDVAYLLPVSAGSFLYIALVNLLPEIQEECRVAKVLPQIGWLLAGAGLVSGVILWWKV